MTCLGLGRAVFVVHSSYISICTFDHQRRRANAIRRINPWECRLSFPRPHTTQSDPEPALSSDREIKTAFKTLMIYVQLKPIDSPIAPCHQSISFVFVVCDGAELRGPCVERSTTILRILNRPSNSSQDPEADNTLTILQLC
jgi:hypothetical protein